MNDLTSIKNSAATGNRRYEKVKNYFPQIILIIFFFSFLGIQYGTVFFHPDEYLFAANGDGIKNYYTFAYHIENDNSYLHFGGLNHPYGEHIGYTDGHPFLSWIFQTLPFLSPYKIGILNFILLGGMAVTALLFYSVLRKYKVEISIAIAGSIAYTLLQPQIYRLGGHLSLSHSFFFLSGWYLFLQFCTKQQKIKWSILFALNSLIWFLIHPYTGMMLSFFICGSWFFILSNKLFRKKFRANEIIYPLIQGVFPVLIFLVFMTITDNHVDRNESPSGIFEYTSSFESVFLPNQYPFRIYFGELNQTWEGLSYIGLSTMLLLSGGIISMLILFFKRRTVQEIKNQLFPFHTGALLLAAIVALFFSMGYPFKSYPELLEYAGPMKQFRGLGRFAWIFYYVITIYAVILFNQFYLHARTGNLRIPAWCIGAILFSLLLIEAIPHHQHTAQMISGNKNLFTINNLSPEQKQIIEAINAEEASCIIPVPWFHFGSEYYGTEPDDESMLLSFIVSYHTGIPLFAGATGRTSISETRNIFVAMAPAYVEKKIKSLFSEDEKIMVLVKKFPSNPDEQELLTRSDLILSNSEASLYKIKAKRFFTESVAEKKRQFYSNKNLMFKKNNAFISDSSDRSFRLETYSHTDSGFYYGHEHENQLLFEAGTGTLDSGKIYEVVYRYEPLSTFAMNRLAVIESCYPEGGGTDWFYQKKISSFFVHDDKYTYVAIRFRVDHPEKKHLVTIKGQADPKFRFRVAYLLFHEENNSVFFEKDKTIYFNGIPLISGGEK